MADLKTTLTTTWDGATKGKGRIESSTMDLSIAMPESFGGTGAGANPKDLLLASAVSCYVMTFTAMQEARKLDVADITVDSILSDIPKQGMQIVHEVRVVLSAQATQDNERTAEALIAAADKACMVGNLLKAAGVQISVFGVIVPASPASSN